MGKYYGAKDDSVSKMIQDITEGEVEIGKLAGIGEDDDGATVEADAPIIKLVNTHHRRSVQDRAPRISTWSRWPRRFASATASTACCTR